jgi:hypothetical protein
LVDLTVFSTRRGAVEQGGMSRRGAAVGLIEARYELAEPMAAGRR